jgi:hypothetical protein
MVSGFKCNLQKQSVLNSVYSERERHHVTKVPQTLEQDLGLQQFFALTGAMGQFEGLSMLPIQASLLEAGSHPPSNVAHLQRYIHKNEQTMFNINQKQ